MTSVALSRCTVCGSPCEGDYCDAYCGAVVAFRRDRPARSKPKVKQIVRCRQCSTEFERSSNQRFCSVKCRRVAEAKRARVKIASSPAFRLDPMLASTRPRWRKPRPVDDVQEVGMMIAGGLLDWVSCVKCGLPLSPFSANGRDWQQRGTYCSSCMSAYMQDRKRRLHPTGSECGVCKRWHLGDGDLCVSCTRSLTGQARQRYSELERRQRRAAEEQRKRELLNRTVTRSCRWCLNDYETRPNVKPYCCSGKCLTLWQRHVDLWRAPDRCTIPICMDCGQPFGYREQHRISQRRCHQCAAANTKAHNSRRRGIVNMGDGITVEAIAQRDGTTCHLCDQPIDMTITGVQPDRPTIDHLVPVVHGGEHTWDNVALAHFGCNARRHTRTVDEARALIKPD